MAEESQQLLHHGSDSIDKQSPWKQDRLQAGTLEELASMYQHEGDWDDEEDEEDEDWEPVELPVPWFCVNCTMSNTDDQSHCRLCEEYRESGILLQGHLAPQFTPAEVLTENQKLCTTANSLKRRTLVGYDERMLLHSEVAMKAHPHPERPERIRAILSGFTAAGLLPGRCMRLLSREITTAEVESVHTHELVQSVEATSTQDSSYFTSDTYANRHSALAARLAAGISADLATAIMTGQADNGFALVRPPGHHADDGTIMGFCLHNNACIAAKAAQAAGAKKVLIVDWDVHHGNGTQEIFEEDPSVLYISLHRHENGFFYPGTGAANDVGKGAGEGFCVNIPWGCSGIGDNDYILAFLHIVLPIAKQFAADITIVSAGFDAAKGDPLGGCEVTPKGFAEMTHLLTSLCGGKILVVLEGGYNLRSISASATAVLKVLVGEVPECNFEGVEASESGYEAMVEVVNVQSRYWGALTLPHHQHQHHHINSNSKMKKGEFSVERENGGREM